MNVLITGCQGFVGSAFGMAAAEQGYQVLGISRSAQADRDWPGQHIAADIAHSDLSEVIRDFEPDIFVHAAGSASVGASFGNPIEDLRSSVMTWANALESVRRSGLSPAIIFPSSAAVYGNPKSVPTPEATPVNPISPYGYHKTVCEVIGSEYAECFGLNVVCCRLFSVYGAGQRRLLVWELFQQFLTEDCPAIQGTGKETRDYLHINDAVDACLGLAAERMNRSGILTVNVAFGKQTKVSELAAMIGELTSPEKTISLGHQSRPGDPELWQADTSLLRSLMPHWNPRSLEVGLRECISFWREAR